MTDSRPAISVQDREKTNLIPDVSLNRAFGRRRHILGRENWKQLSSEVQKRIQSDDDAFVSTAPRWVEEPSTDVWTALVRRREGEGRLSPAYAGSPASVVAPVAVDADDLTYTDPEEGPLRRPGAARSEQRRRRAHSHTHSYVLFVEAHQRLNADTHLLLSR